MGRNLSNLFISQSYQFITQISGSELQDGLGNTITGSLLITSSRADNATSASQAISASYSNVATSASYAVVSTSSSFATNANNAVSASVATSASFATTASFALNVTPTNTGSLLVTASAISNVITFTKGDGSTFPVTVATGSAVTVNTGSLLVTASISNATTTFTKGDGSTFSITANNVVNADSASLAANATSASFATTAISSSFATNANTATSASYAVSASQAQNAVTASFVASVVSASYALSSSQAANATTASFAQTIANGLSPTFANVTASNVMITGTASVALLYTQTVSSSVIYSSGSNQFGDASNDVQTLYGTFNVVNGPTNFTGSVNSVNGYTGSLQGTASFADNATSASVAISSSFATSASQAVSSSFATTASFALNVTPIDTSSFATTGSNTFIGNETISGSLNVSGSVTGNVLGNNTDTYTSSPRVQQVVTLTQAEYNAIGSPDANTLYIISGSAPFNPANFATTGSNTFVGNQVISGSLTVTGSLIANGAVTINNTASADVWLVDTKPFAQLSTDTIVAGRIDGADEDFILAGRNFNGTVPSITMTDGVFVYNEAAHQFTGSVGFDGAVTVNDAVTISGSLNVSGSIGASNIIQNNTDTFTGSAKIYEIVTCTQAEYNTVSGSANAANTLYVISDSTGGGQFVSGSLTSNVNALTITSQTASLDCSLANFFTLTLVSGSTTHVSASNLSAGQTINLRVTQASSATGSISFTSNIKQVSGSAYVPTAVTSSVDIVTFISFDTSNLYLSNIKNFV